MLLDRPWNSVEVGQFVVVVEEEEAEEVAWVWHHEKRQRDVQVEVVPDEVD